MTRIKRNIDKTSGEVDVMIGDLNEEVTLTYTPPMQSGHELRKEGRRSIFSNTVLPEDVDFVIPLEYLRRPELAKPDRLVEFRLYTAGSVYNVKAMQGSKAVDLVSFPKGDSWMPRFDPLPGSLALNLGSTDVLKDLARFASKDGQIGLAGIQIRESEEEIVLAASDGKIAALKRFMVQEPHDDNGSERVCALLRDTPVVRSVPSWLGQKLRVQSSKTLKRSLISLAGGEYMGRPSADGPFKAGTCLRQMDWGDKRMPNLEGVIPSVEGKTLVARLTRGAVEDMSKRLYNLRRGSGKVSVLLLADDDEPLIVLQPQPPEDAKQSVSAPFSPDSSVWSVFFKGVQVEESLVLHFRAALLEKVMRVGACCLYTEELGALVSGYSGAVAVAYENGMAGAIMPLRGSYRDLNQDALKVADIQVRKELGS